MSDHELPLDPASWPTDPFRLLGVTPGVPARELRKAYLKLIRVFKPEHHPDEFQKIRQAYETALAISKHFEEPVESFEEPIAREFLATTEPDPGPTRVRSEPTPDPWSLACQGHSDLAYGALLELQVHGSPAEEVFLQLYWLLALGPGLDLARLPIDWLIQGLQRCGPRAGRLRELLRREVDSDPTEALAQRIVGFFQSRPPPTLVLDVAIPRWKSARVEKRWSSIVGDIQALRGWLPGVDSDAWASLLLAASTQLAWGDAPESDHAIAYCREVERLAHHQNDFAEELYQVEFIQILKSGLDRLGERSDNPVGLWVLLSHSWDEPGPFFARRLRSYIEQIARNPRVSLHELDRVQGLSPAVLGRISGLLGGIEYEDLPRGQSRGFAEFAPVIGQFLAEHRWNEYRAIRLPLLRFCLQEAISPGLVARTLTERPEFVLTGKSPLAQEILDDWPLRHVYRATELSWEPVTSREFGD